MTAREQRATSQVMGTEQIAWMREHGVLSASWHPDGSLASATLSPYAAVEPQMQVEEAQSEPQPAKPEDTEARRRRMFAAVPGFRLRDG